MSRETATDLSHPALGVESSETRRLTQLKGLISRGRRLILTDPRQAESIARAALKLTGSELDEDRPLRAEALRLLSDCAFQNGQYLQCIEFGDLAINALAEAPEPAHEAGVMITQGHALRALARLPEALDRLLSALTMVQALRDPTLEARCLNAIGIVYGESEDHVRALECFRQSLADYRQIGDQRGESFALCNISQSLQRLNPQDQGRQQEALDCARTAVEIYQRLGLGRDETLLLGTLGGAYRLAGQLDESLRVLEQAHAIATLRARNSARADLAIELGLTLVALGRHEDAIPALETGARESFELNMSLNIGRAYRALATCFEQSGAFDRALAAHKTALLERERQLKRESEDRLAAVRSRHEIRLVRQQVAESDERSVQLRAEVEKRMGELKAEVERREEAQRALRDAVYVDRLTGAISRFALIERIEARLELLRVDSTSGFAVLFFDLDRFKRFNTSLGYSRADRLLKLVAERAAGYLEGDDELARLAADEFAVLMIDVSSIDIARSRAAALLEALREPFVLDGAELYLTASAGLVIGSQAYVRPEHLLLDADTARTRSKLSGRKLEVFESQMRAQASHEFKLERELRQAISAGEFAMHYQPLVDLRSGTLRGFEALVRWPHRTRGLLGPGQFLDLVDQLGLNTALDRIVMGRVVEQVKRWRMRHPQQCSRLYFNVNVTADHLRSEPDLRALVGMIDDYDLPRSAFKLEITETRLIDLGSESLRLLGELRAQGVAWVIDDFGTGYSSLSYLQRLPAHTLKIDQSFVAGLLDNTKDAQIVDMMIRLAQALELEVVAEGVEHETQARRLYELGCNIAQGYLYAAPLEAEQAEAWIAGSAMQIDVP